MREKKKRQDVACGKEKNQTHTHQIKNIGEYRFIQCRKHLVTSTACLNLKFEKFAIFDRGVSASVYASVCVCI